MSNQNRYFDKESRNNKAKEKSNYILICKNNFLAAQDDIKVSKTSLSCHHRFIITGRILAKLFLEAYNTSSDTDILFKILEIYQMIAPFYPKVILENDMSAKERSLIQDKCKYYVHLILVLFHLNKMDIVMNELMSFKQHLHAFKKYIPNEYKTIYGNIKELLNSFTHVSVFSDRQRHLNIYNRIGFQSYELQNISSFNVKKLHRAIIVGSCATQVPLTGITIDMFRISQAIEMKIGLTTNCKNARKWMFYNSSFLDLEIGISNAAHNISTHGILLLYVSGDAYRNKSKNLTIKNPLYEFGVKMKQDSDENVEHSKVECLYPADILAFPAVPTVLIIDCECSVSFQELYKYKEESFMCLLSPAKYPTFIEIGNSGKLFTLFLTSPQTGFCWVCHNTRVDSVLWRKVVNMMNEFMLVALEVVKRWCLKYTDSKLGEFINDYSSRAFILRYLFCLVTLKLHNEFYDEDYYPKSNFTALESEILAKKELHSIIYKMSSSLDASDYFIISSDLSISNQTIDVEI